MILIQEIETEYTFIVSVNGYRKLTKPNRKKLIKNKICKYLYAKPRRANKGFVIVSAILMVNYYRKQATEK